MCTTLHTISLHDIFSTKLRKNRNSTVCYYDHCVQRYIGNFYMTSSVQNSEKTEMRRFTTANAVYNVTQSIFTWHLRYKTLKIHNFEGLLLQTMCKELHTTNLTHKFQHTTIKTEKFTGLLLTWCVKLPRMNKDRHHFFPYWHNG